MARSVIVGDVHGCLRELELLLERIGLGASDQIYFVGDLVSRGPDSQGVIALARRLNAHAVLGNHEWRLLEARRARRNSEPRPPLGPSQQMLLKAFSDDEWSWLESRQLVIDLADHELRIVHAGLVPGRPMGEQTPEILTRIRSLSRSGEPSERLGDSSWAEQYRGPPHVVFGHNAQRGLQLHRYATGLDTGCVYGGMLSALVLEQGETVPIDDAERRRRLVSVNAARIYFHPRLRPKRRTAM